MPNLPNVEKFKGDNEVNFHNWILRVEAQVGGIPNARRNQMLLCSLDATTSTYLSQQLRTALSNNFHVLITTT